MPIAREAKGEAVGDRSGDGEGKSEGDGSGEVDGDGSGDGEGKTDGEGNGEVVGDGNGSPTCLTIRGASGLRRERIIEGTLGGAIGCGSWPFLTSSRFGNTPSGAPATATPLL